MQQNSVDVEYRNTGLKIQLWESNVLTEYTECKIFFHPLKKDRGMLCVIVNLQQGLLQDYNYMGFLFESETLYCLQMFYSC